MVRRQEFDAWLSTIARAIGMIGLIAFGVVWIVSDRVEPVLVTTAGILYGLGKGGEALATLRNGPGKES